MTSDRCSLFALPGIPDVQPGDDAGRLLLDALDRAGLTLLDGDVLAVAQKIISKAEGRLVDLATIMPSERALELAGQSDKDPRLVELILRESEEVSRVRPGVIIVRHRLGFTSANAGIDRSNVGPDGSDVGPDGSDVGPDGSDVGPDGSDVGPDGEERVLLLPVDPDDSARRIRDLIIAERGATVGVVITDSHGRPFRLGTVGVAIGVAGLPALWDRRGEADRYGYRLQHTDVGVADEIAAAAGLLMGQAAEGQPAVLIRGLSLPPVDGRAVDLVRPKEIDLYR